jgi:hypothetical protein
MTKTEISCPTCGKENTWQPENKDRPFCSPRCKLIDLGEWAHEGRRIAGEPTTSSDMLDEEKNKGED